MQITVKVIESNARIDGTAIANGVRVEVTGLPELTGSEKQIAWANQIRETAIVDGVTQIAQSALAKQHPNCIWAATDLDAAIAKQNAFAAQLAGKLARATTASAWIDARNSDPAQVLRNVTARG